MVSVLGGRQTSGRIVEAEAYTGPDDGASHAARLKRGRVLLMWGMPGLAYVYRSYGVHPMLNAVCEREGEPGAVLIRALEPLEGVGVMEERRGTAEIGRLCRGPGSLTVALGITLEDHGRDLVTDAELWMETGAAPEDICAGPRIGISRSVEHPWRFFEADNRFVSAHRRGEPVR
jgi:DNA-3-methyladenine glycosylase